MRVLALSGSPSGASINAALLDHALSLLPDGVQVDRASVLDLDQPFYRPEREAAEGVPADLRALHARIQAADAVLLASPEYNGGMPAMLKNTIGWLSRVDRGAPWWGAEVVGRFSLGGFFQAFDREGGGLRQKEQAEALSELVDALVTAAAR